MLIARYPQLISHYSTYALLEHNHMMALYYFFFVCLSFHIRSRDSVILSLNALMTSSFYFAFQQLDKLICHLLYPHIEIQIQLVWCIRVSMKCYMVTFHQHVSVSIIVFIIHSTVWGILRFLYFETVVLTTPMFCSRIFDICQRKANNMLKLYYVILC